ncbi:MAG: 30S ribosomal protein S20 [Bacteroidales bacterium]|nr:30S ribosomal protein S20 [Bacteroidales bacterium]
MANHKSSVKRVRANERKKQANHYYSKTMRNALRDIRAIEDKNEAMKRLSAMTSMIDKLAKRGMIHKNKAANLKSGLVKKINAL